MKTTPKILLKDIARAAGCSVAVASRAALKGYHPRVLDALICLSALGAICVYLHYALAADTIARFGTRGLAFTAIFVALGIVRYMMLLYRKEDVGRPERVLLTDKVLWLILAGYGLTALWVVKGEW